MVLHKEHLAPLKMGGNSETASEEGKVHRGRRPEEERPLGEGSLGGDSIDILDGLNASFNPSLDPSRNHISIQCLPKRVLNLVLNPSLNPSLNQSLKF